MLDVERKLFLGGRLKRLRRDLGLSQTRMAEDLGISPSYQNHLERNQRPLTAQVLLRLAQTYDIDLRAFSGEADAGGEADLNEVFADPMFRDLAVPRHEIGQLMQYAPGAAEATVRLYRALADRRRREAIGTGEGETWQPPDARDPMAWVSDYIQARNNHFPELEQPAEAMAADLQGRAGGFEQAAAQRLLDRHGLQTRIMPADVMIDWARSYDLHRRRLMLSELLPASGRSFGIAYQLGLQEQGQVLDSMVEAARPPDLPTRRLLKVALTNYMAAAVMMPYGRFFEAAEALAYDLRLLGARFGASLEQTCHRLTTLARPSARGAPFFFLRIDRAGNVSKRFAGAGLSFARQAGSCPRWSLHAAFAAPGRIHAQVIETMDGARYFTLACTLERPHRPHGQGDGVELAIALGCELKFADRLVYAQGQDLARTAATQVGRACRLCERPACQERAAPPLTRTLTVEEWSKTLFPYSFSTHG